MKRTNVSKGKRYKHLKDYYCHCEHPGNMPDGKGHDGMCWNCRFQLRDTKGEKE